MPVALQSYAKRLTRIAAQRWAPTLVFLVLASFVEGSRSWAIRGSWFAGFSLEVNFFMCGAAVLGTSIAAATSLRGRRSVLTSVVITSLCVGAALWVLFQIRTGSFNAVANGFVVSNAAFALRTFWSILMAGLLFSTFCAAREREIEMLAAARNAALERANVQHALLDSRLQVLQAQIDPTLLFDGLADVHRLYRMDISAAETRLDELIAYLRAALPKAHA